MLCSVNGCNSKSYSKGMCAMHYERMKRLGSTDLPEKVKEEKPCSVAGCSSVAKTMGMCRKHYRSFRLSEVRQEKLQRRKKNTCSIVGCTLKPRNNGMCSKHYKRHMKGNVFSAKNIKLDFTLKERFLFLCSEDQETSCWEWNGSKDRDGYGRLSVADKNQRTHRLSYELFKGVIPENYCVCHTCDNPSCVNPEHLFLGSNQENTSDKVAKGRQAKGSTNGQSILKESDVSSIRKRLASGESCAAIGRSLGVTSWTISRIKHGKNWKHIQ